MLIPYGVTITRRFDWRLAAAYAIEMAVWSARVAGLAIVVTATFIVVAAKAVFTVATRR